MAKVTIGTVSAGTLKTEDLLECFLDILARLDSEHPLIVEVAYGRDNSPELLESVMEALTDHCPPFVYFGAHPGDGADFGFWPDIERLEMDTGDAVDLLCVDPFLYQREIS